MLIILKKLTSLASIDKSIIYAVLSRLWQAFAGIISMLLIASYFTPELQGYYFTFSSLLALQVFIELGLYVVVVNITSHEWSKLALDNDGYIYGDETALSRLVSFGRKLVKWYGVASIAFFFVASAVGYYFLSQNTVSNVNWHGPWLFSVFISSILLVFMPLISILEGCNQVEKVFQYKLIEVVVSNFTLWIFFVLGLGLWSVAARLFISLLVLSFLVFIKYKKFFKVFIQCTVTKCINWKDEVFPMQWKLGLQGVVNYFMYSLYTPVIFFYYGAIEAGKMGMTLQLFSAMQGLALAWLQTRVPEFGNLVAKNKIIDLNKLWKRMTVISLLVFFILSLFSFIVLMFLDNYYVQIADRLLNLELFIILSLSGLIAIWVQASAYYWRAHKEEPLGIAGAIPGLINGALVWFCGKNYGVIGALGANLVTLVIISYPLANYLKASVSKKYH